MPNGVLFPWFLNRHKRWEAVPIGGTIRHYGSLPTFRWPLDIVLRERR
jgi:hypothetical protein